MTVLLYDVFICDLSAASIRSHINIMRIHTHGINMEQTNYHIRTMVKKMKLTMRQ